MTSFYFGKEKREKKKREEESSPESNHHVVVYTCGTNKKSIVRHFQCYPKRQHLDME